MSLVESEAAWLAADPTVASLGIEVVAYARRHPANVPWAVLWRERRRERRLAGDVRERTHFFVVSLSWPLTSGAANLVSDQKALEALMDALIARIGSDVRHGGLFLSVGDEADGGIADEVADPVEAVGPGVDEAALKAAIRYPATEQLVVS